MRADRETSRGTRAASWLPWLVLVTWVCAPLGAQTPPPPPAGQPPQASAPPSQTTPSTGPPGQAPVPPAGQPPAQASGQAAAPTVISGVKFATPAGALLASIKPTKAADYEWLLAMYVEALKKSGDPERAKMAAGFRFYKAAEPAPGSTNLLYVVEIDPALPEGDYSWQAMLACLYAAFPEQASSIFEKATTVHAAPTNKLSLTPVTLSTAEPPAPAPPPK